MKLTCATCWRRLCNQKPLLLVYLLSKLFSVFMLHSRPLMKSCPKELSSPVCHRQISRLVNFMLFYCLLIAWNVCHQNYAKDFITTSLLMNWITRQNESPLSVSSLFFFFIFFRRHFTTVRQARHSQLNLRQAFKCLMNCVFFCVFRFALKNFHHESQFYMRDI